MIFKYCDSHSAGPDSPEGSREGLAKGVSLEQVFGMSSVMSGSPDHATWELWQVQPEVQATPGAAPILNRK